MKEDNITSWFAAQSKIDPARFPIGIGDDMAQMALDGGASVLITTDMLLDGVHFDLRTASLEQVGYKSMAASLSDCAAMATIPLCAVCAVGLPKGFGQAELKEFYVGLTRAGRMFDCELVGGDITAWKETTGKFAVNVTILSKPSGYHLPVRRNGAKPGDYICVSGPLGGSLAGKHLSFTPRVRLALEMTKVARIHAMMDLSDGLSTDLNRICTQSKVGAMLDAAAIPISDAARQLANPLAAAMNDGEDFELLFTVSPEEWSKLNNAKTAWAEPALQGSGIYRVGVVTDTGRMEIKMSDGNVVPVEPKGFDHL
jgi:thiamine-monophosphate kinase